jgi:protein-L-isoaspartate(D-aspartate) O-methyltransferase
MVVRWKNFAGGTMSEFDAARLNMVNSQVRTNKVTDPELIAALGRLPRELFVDDRLEGVAYLDEDLPLGKGRFVMEPMVMARMIQALEIGIGDVVLEVGGGTGYAGAVMAQLASTVVLLEPDADFAGRATRTLSELAIDNAVVVDGALAEGYASQGPYDAILLGGAVSAIPAALTAQLADGGRLCAVVADGTRPGTAVLATRHGGSVAQRELFDANVPVLPGFAAEPGFVF